MFHKSCFTFVPKCTLLLYLGYRENWRLVIRVLQVLRVRRLVIWLYWEFEDKWSDCIESSKTSELTVLRVRRQVNWLYWEFEDKWPDCIESSKTSDLTVLRVRRQVIWLYWGFTIQFNVSHVCWTADWHIVRRL